MKKQGFIIGLILSASMVSCDLHNQNVVVGTGDVESMERELPSFSGVSVIGLCDVDISVGGDQHVELFAQAEILDVLTTTVRNGILEISYKPHVQIKPSKKISAQINIPALSFISVSGSGNFYLEGIAQEQLDIIIEGHGDVDAYNLEITNCNVIIEGSGSCQVNVSGNLDVNIAGTGSITYMGSPDITQDISGLGSVRPL